MKRCALLLALTMVTGCDSSSENGGPAAVDPDQEGSAAIEFTQTWGGGVGAGKVTPVSALLADPDAYVGQTVRVEGTAVAVCEHRGCWFNIASDQEGEVLKFKVPDGEMVFPLEIVGETMRAEGVFTANELDLETTRQVCAAEAEQAGEPFDPASVTECMTRYQISGTGAVQLAKLQ